MRVLPWICAAVATVSLGGHALADGDGLTTQSGRVPWARFDARIAYAGAPAWRADLAPLERSGLKLGSVLGDVYFGPPSAGAVHTAPAGFRATSGVLLGAHPTLSGTNAVGGLYSRDRRVPGALGSSLAGPLDPAGDTATVAYLGVGYSNAWPKSGWRFSADLGVMSLSPSGASGIGRVIGGAQSLDDLVRDMRLAPVFQLGVSYSF